MSNTMALARTLAAIRRSTGLNRKEFGEALAPLAPYAERAVKRWELEERDVPLKLIVAAVDIVNNIQQVADVVYDEFPCLDTETDQEEYFYDLRGPRPVSLQTKMITDAMYLAGAGLAAARRIDEGAHVIVQD